MDRAHQPLAVARRVVPVVPAGVPLRQHPAPPRPAHPGHHQGLAGPPCARAAVPARRPPSAHPAALDHCVADAIAEYQPHPDFTELELDDDTAQRFFAECRELAANYMTLEDPRGVRAIGLELRLAAPVSDDLTLRGIIDRLELDERRRAGRHRLQDRPRSASQLRAQEPDRRAVLRVPVRVGVRPHPGRDAADVPQVRRGDHRGAVAAVDALHDHPHQRRLEGGRHRLRARRLPPKPSTLCNYCAYQRWCPEYGGDPAHGRGRGAASCSPACSAPSSRSSVAVSDADQDPRTWASTWSRSFGPSSTPSTPPPTQLLEQLRDHPLADRLFLAASHPRRLQPDLARRLARPRRSPAADPTRRSCWRPRSVSRA